MRDRCVSLTYTYKYFNKPWRDGVPLTSLIYKLSNMAYQTIWVAMILSWIEEQKARETSSNDAPTNQWYNQKRAHLPSLMAMEMEVSNMALMIACIYLDK